jgi:RNA 2',3'-cyclic 3'-phosphodiesterase
VSSERARLFVALELPASVRAQLAQWTETSLRGLPLRLVDPGSLHVTLCFLGSRDTGAVGEIAAACQAAASRSAISMVLGAALWLPQRRPRVLAVQLTDQQGAAATLQAELASALQAGGFYEPEDRPFLAHVTVARVSRGGRPERAELPPPAPVRFETRAVTVYRSQLGSGPARYEPLETVVLSG